MDDFRGHDADGGQVLELSLHDVEKIVEIPGLVGHSQEEERVHSVIPKSIQVIIMIQTSTEKVSREQ